MPRSIGVAGTGSFRHLRVVIGVNPQRQRHRARANAGLDESGDAAHQATFLLFGWLRSLRAWLSATRAARSTGLGGGGGTEPVRKCGGWLSGLLRGHMLMMQPAFAVVFWCEPERQQSGLAVLEEGHLAMRR